MKKLLRMFSVTEAKFGADEDKMVYFFLLPYLRKEHYKAVGIEKEEGYPYPVSYTHLDVYKRQKGKRSVNPLHGRITRI